MCQKPALLHRLFVVIRTPLERQGLPRILSIQRPTTITQPTFQATQKEGRALTALELERFCLLAQAGAQDSVVEIKLLDDWLRRGGGFTL